MRRLPADGVVLAGGESRRFGGDKALYVWEGRTLLERAVASLEAVTGRVWLAGRDRPRYDFVGLPTLDDAVEGGGPLAPVVAALRLGRPVLVLAVDLFPVFPEDWEALYRASLAYGASCVAGEPPQPLVGVYHPACLPVAEEELHGRRRLMAMVERVPAALVALGHRLVNANTLGALPGCK